MIGRLGLRVLFLSGGAQSRVRKRPERKRGLGAGWLELQVCPAGRVMKDSAPGAGP